MDEFSDTVATIQSIAAVPNILDVVCRTTGLRFAAVARVTAERWIACTVMDKLDFGLKPGGELKIESTICHEIRQSHKLVVIDNVSEDCVFREHHTPRQYGFQSYISVPIILANGQMFGTLCALDPMPARVNTPEIIGMFNLFAELIAFHIDAADKLALSESRLAAERGISDLREQFIGVLGHDLRNPLGAIAMGARLLKETKLDEEQAAAVAMMQRSISRMAGLIDDAVDLTRGRLGGGIVLEEQCDDPIEPVLREVLEEIGAVWPERKIDAQWDLRETIHYDRKRISQLFTNLLANAMIHGRPQKPVRVRASDADGKFEFSVTNAAEPIPPATLRRLFEPFRRGNSKNYGQGLGLGLYIASEIAKSHGGSIVAASDETATCFTFAMPLSHRSVGSKRTAEVSGKSPEPTAHIIPLPPRSARILLIEDHVDTLGALSRLLTRRGHSITAATNGAEARMEFARSRFDLIVSDLGLPDCSGLELIGEFSRAHPTPAIAMSGYGMEADVSLCKAVGFAEHVTKPIDFDPFLKIVNRLTSASSP